MGTAGQFSVNGLRSRGNNFTIDGSDNNDEDIGVRRQGFTALVPQPIESVKQFQIATLLPEPQFGRSLGAQANVVSRSGTNTFRGLAYGLFTDRRLNSRDFFDLTGEPQRVLQCLVRPRIRAPSSSMASSYFNQIPPVVRILSRAARQDLWQVECFARRNHMYLDRSNIRTFRLAAKAILPCPQLPNGDCSHKEQKVWKRATELAMSRFGDFSFRLPPTGMPSSVCFRGQTIHSDRTVQTHEPKSCQRMRMAWCCQLKRISVGKSATVSRCLRGGSISVMTTRFSRLQVKLCSQPYRLRCARKTSRSSLIP